VVSDRRAKLIDKLNHQKSTPDYRKPTTKRGKPKKEVVCCPAQWLDCLYCRWGHSQLEFALGMKGISTSLTNLPVIDRLIAATNEGVFDQQMAACPMRLLRRSLVVARSQLIVRSQQPPPTRRLHENPTALFPGRAATPT
jgi:hypothetical protein